MGQSDEHDKKPLLERLIQAYDSLDDIFALLIEINSAASLNDDLTSSERALLSQLGSRVQELAAQTGALPREVAPVQQSPFPPLTEPKLAPKEPSMTHSDRRKSSKSFDALLLMGIKYSIAEGKSVSQDRLFKLGSAYDPNTKRASLIAKLNRWKNTNGFIHWERPQLITLTELGQREVEVLEGIVSSEGDINQLRTTITNTLGVAPSS